MEWDKLWAINKSIIDPICGRYTAISSKSLSHVTITNLPDDHNTVLETPLHPKEKLGNKNIF